MTTHTPPPGQPPYRGTGGRDPRQPFGTGPLAVRRHGTTDGQRPVGPTPPRRLGPLLVSLLLMLAVAGATWAASRYLTDPASPATPTPTPTPAAPSGSASPRPSVAPSATAPHSQVPFTSSVDNSSGTFRISAHRWTSQGLELDVQVHLDQGSQRLGFFCLDNATTRDYDPSAASGNSIAGRTITAGQTLTGTVVFDKPRGDTTVFLTGSDGRQVAALLVTG